jgi:hypothetical protein
MALSACSKDSAEDLLTGDGSYTKEAQSKILTFGKTTADKIVSFLEQGEKTSGYNYSWTTYIVDYFTDGVISKSETYVFYPNSVAMQLAFDAIWEEQGDKIPANSSKDGLWIGTVEDYSEYDELPTYDTVKALRKSAGFSIVE